MLNGHGWHEGGGSGRLFVEPSSSKLAVIWWQDPHTTPTLRAMFKQTHSFFIHRRCCCCWLAYFIFHSPAGENHLQWWSVEGIRQWCRSDQTYPTTSTTTRNWRNHSVHEFEGDVKGKGSSQLGSWQRLQTRRCKQVITTTTVQGASEWQISSN